MTNDTQRKLISIALVSIMFAGGMTIAIPGELPTAVAQSTGTLSVSAAAAGVFGGPQAIEIVIDDPDLSEIGTDANAAVPDVEVDGDAVIMAQAATGKWYAYIADTSAYGASGLLADDSDGSFIVDLPALADGQQWYSDIVQMYEFEDGDTVEITAGRDEVVTLDYDDHSDIATISVDRNGVPVGGQVHVTINDFQLNLDPTVNDRWILNAADNKATYNDAGVKLVIAIGGTTGQLAISGPDTDVIMYNNGDGPADVVVFDETGSNTGVFESQYDNVSEITVSGNASGGDTFTIGYADDDQQVIVDDFDSNLELIADGTWDSAETLTIRLSSENLDLNTLEDNDMTKASDDLPVLILGDPITLGNVAVAISDEQIGESISVSSAHVATLNATKLVTIITVTLTDEQNDRLKDETMSHYAHFSSEYTYDPKEITGATSGQIEGNTGTITLSNGLTAINATGDADGIFNVTFTAATHTFPYGAVSKNAAIYASVDAAETEAATVSSTPKTVKQAAAEAYIGELNPDEFQTAIDAIDDNADVATIDSVLTAINTAAETSIVTAGFIIVLDIFSFGADVNHAIYRALLEETASDSAVFEGTVEYKMLNQLSVNDPATHMDITTIDDELTIILNDGYTGTSAPTVAYDGDHVMEDAPTYTGEVSFDADTYRVSDEVTVTLVDPDLNVDSGIDTYTIDAKSEDATATLLHLEIADGCTIDDFENFSLRETTGSSGTFEGSFDVPATCGGLRTTAGEGISATYYDFRDASGGATEWGDSATIRASTGSVGFDRTVYPVPAEGSAVTVYVSVEDGDFDESSTSVESIAVSGDAPVTVKVGSTTIAELGTEDNPLEETDGDSGIFEYTLEVTNSDDSNYDIEQGSIITVTYNDPTGASGNENSVSDSATFDLRNAVLQSDKSAYVIGQDALLTLIEPDLNLDSDGQETIPLTVISWESDADGTNLSNGAFGAVPSSLRETDVNTGIFQVVITMPEEINGNALERGEEITLTYTDDGPSGADTVGETDRDVELLIETSNFGATIELDQDVYTWTDKVFITTVASDYNFDSNAIDEIGPDGDGEITVRVRGGGLAEYKLAETGPDTGVFTGEITLAGFTYDSIDYTAPETSGSGPTDGTLNTNNEDGLSVSFEYSDSEAPLVASALIRWNVGEVQWLDASYAATGSGIVRVIDPDMNTNPNAVDNIDDIVVYSETFVGGIELTVTETQEASGIFEGTVEFDPESASQGHRLQVTEGDIVTAEYDDYTLPHPGGKGDNLAISATTLIGSMIPTLERAPASNPAIVDAFGNALASVSVDQQVQITADITSGQDRDQDFAYLVQIQNEEGVTVALSWITGTLGAGATFSPSQSWTPSETGSYTATTFVWESVSNPTALSPQLSIAIDVV